MADSPQDTGSPESGSFIGDLNSQVGDAAKQVSDTIYANTPDTIKDGVMNAFSAVLGNETNTQPHTTLASQPAPPSAATTGDAPGLPGTPHSQQPAAPSHSPRRPTWNWPAPRSSAAIPPRTPPGK